ncbi:hypothetical protein [Chelativorans sp. Marseille-P2723]|uniref:hypothetical protein n=1 Tax=Chelativorans sp. Marseille-P2723 TaxID=2709133 RepID=UPI00156D9DA6|nr:hypothetical protein [Chelativorans sp. Marseille-P2723]
MGKSYSADLRHGVVAFVEAGIRGVPRRDILVRAACIRFERIRHLQSSFAFLGGYRVVTDGLGGALPPAPSSIDHRTERIKHPDRPNTSPHRICDAIPLQQVAPSDGPCCNFVALQQNDGTLCRTNGIDGSA